MAKFSLVNTTQDQLRDAIAMKLHEAGMALANAAVMTSALEGDQAFVSLAKVNAENLATMCANLESRIRFPL